MKEVIINRSVSGVFETQIFQVSGIVRIQLSGSWIGTVSIVGALGTVQELDENRLVFSQIGSCQYNSNQFIVIENAPDFIRFGGTLIGELKIRLKW